MLASALGVAGLPATPSAAERALPFCTALAVSPTFPADRTAFCVGPAGDAATGTVTGVTVLVTRDAGASWSEAAAAGLPMNDATLIGSVAVSPRFTADRTVFVQTSLGVYASDDLGASFRLLDSFAAPGFTGTDNVAAYVEQAPLPVGGSEPRTVLAYAGGDRTRRIDPPLSVPAVGAPGEDYQVVAVPDGATTRLLVMTTESDPAGSAARPYRDALYACDAALTCAEPLTRFAAGWYAERLWAGTPSGSGPAPLFVQLRKAREDHLVQVLTSNDGGRTFAPWPAVTRLLAPLAAVRARWPRVWVTERPGRPSDLYLRLAHDGVRTGAASRAPSTESLYRSTDRGRSWRLVATNGYGTPRGVRGRLGWTDSDARSGPRIVATADGRLFATGGHPTYVGVFCSRDGGATWGYRCRR